MNKEIGFLFFLKTVVANTAPEQLQPVQKRIVRRLCDCSHSICFFSRNFKCIYYFNTLLKDSFKIIYQCLKIFGTKFIFNIITFYK